MNVLMFTLMVTYHELDKFDSNWSHNKMQTEMGAQSG